MIEWSIPACPACGAEGITLAQLYGEVVSHLLAVRCRCGHERRLQTEGKTTDPRLIHAPRKLDP